MGPPLIGFVTDSLTVRGMIVITMRANMRDLWPILETRRDWIHRDRWCVCHDGKRLRQRERVLRTVGKGRVALLGGFIAGPRCR
jgi:hypothetical protein